MQLHSTTAQPPLMSTYLPYAKKMQQMAMEINQQQQQQPTYNALKLDQERALDSDIEAEIEEHDDAVDTTIEDGEDDEEHNNFQDNDQNDSYDEHARELNDIKEHVLPNVPAEHDDDDVEDDNGIAGAVASADAAANVAAEHSVAEHSNADDDEEEDVASEVQEHHDDDVHADGEADEDSSLVAEAKIAADDDNASAGGSSANASADDDADTVEDNIAPATIDSNEYAKTAIMHDNLQDLKTHNIVGNDLKTVDVKTQQQQQQHSEPAVEVRLKQISQEVANNNNNINLKQLNNEQNIAATSPQHSGIISNLHHHTQLDSDDIGRQSFLSLTDLIRTLRPNDKQIIPQIDSDYSNAMRVLGEPANNGNLKH